MASGVDKVIMTCIMVQTSGLNVKILVKYLDIPGTLVFSHYTTARLWYAPRDMAKTNNSEI